jgi:hypothetical protein
MDRAPEQSPTFAGDHLTQVPAIRAEAQVPQAIAIVGAQDHGSAHGGHYWRVGEPGRKTWRSSETAGQRRRPTECVLLLSAARAG